MDEPNVPLVVKTVEGVDTSLVIGKVVDTLVAEVVIDELLVSRLLVVILKVENVVDKDVRLAETLKPLTPLTLDRLVEMLAPSKLIEGFRL